MCSQAGNIRGMGLLRIKQILIRNGNGKKTGSGSQRSSVTINATTLNDDKRWNVDPNPYVLVRTPGRMRKAKGTGQFKNCNDYCLHAYRAIKGGIRSTASRIIIVLF